LPQRPRLRHASGARHLYRTLPSADALGYLLDAPPALFKVARCILDRSKFPAQRDHLATGC